MDKVCKKLLDYDPDIVEIVQFGSSIRAPEQAKDTDLLAITRRPKDYYGYLDAIGSAEPPAEVDVIVVEPGAKLREELLRGIIASSKAVYGDGKYILEMAKNLGDPTFGGAKAALRVASKLFKPAQETADPLERDRLFREAYNTLFHAARTAASAAPIELGEAIVRVLERLAERLGEEKVRLARKKPATSTRGAFVRRNTA